MRDHNNYGQVKKGNVRHNWMRFGTAKKCTTCGVVLKLIYVAGDPNPHRQFTKNGVTTSENPPCEHFDSIGNKI